MTESGLEAWITLGVFNYSEPAVPAANDSIRFQMMHQTQYAAFTTTIA